MVFHVKENETKELCRASSLLDMLGANGLAAQDARRVGRLPGRDYLLQSFRTANECFELIQPTQGIVVPYREGGQEIINKLNSSPSLAVEWHLQRKAQTYTVNVFDWQFRKLLAEGAIYPVDAATGVYCLQPQYYDEDYGLRTDSGLMETQFG